MALLGKGPCDLSGWEPDETCLKLPDTTTPEQRLFWQRVAAEILYNRTGQRFGDGCSHTVRPCRRKCLDGFIDLLRFPGGVANSTGGWIPYIGPDGEFRNASLCGCRTDCHCGSELCQIELPGPIRDITRVDVNGTVLNSACYFSYDARFLILRPDVVEQIHPDLDVTCWPTCQDLSKPAGQDGTFSVTYSVGLAVPFMAQAAMAEIMNHLASQCNGCGCGADARQNLQRLSRQGVQLEFADAQQVFTDGRIGLPLADLFVQTYNPGALPRAMRVLSPDSPKRPRIELGY